MTITHRSAMERIRRPLAVATILALTLGMAGTTAPVAAATPLVTMTISQSPSVAAAGAPVTYTGKVTPVSGTPKNVTFGMQATNGNFTGGTCEPVAHCNGGFDPSWTYASITSTVTVTFTTTARIGRKVTFFLLGGTAGCSGTCPPSVTQRGPTITTSGTWTSTGQVIAGATLRVTVRAKTDAGPVQGDLHVDLPPGVDAPTNLPVDASYSSSSHYIDDVVTLSNTAEYAFDVAINAADGTTMTFAIIFMPTNSENPTAGSTLTVHVGSDVGLPTATGPMTSLVAGTAVASSLLPVKLSWSGSDAASGVEHFELAQSTDAGAWSTVDAALLTSSTYRWLPASHTYRFRVRAVDHAGNRGAWAYGTTFSLSTYSETSSTIRYGGTWATTTSASYRGGKAKVTSTAGRTASRTFTGRAIAWLALRGPTKGKANVYVNGTLVATVDLYAASTQPQRLVWTRTWSTSASRLITIRVLGTSGRPSVNLDGLVIIR